MVSVRSPISLEDLSQFLQIGWEKLHADKWRPGSLSRSEYEPYSHQIKFLESTRWMVAMLQMGHLSQQVMTQSTLWETISEFSSNLLT